MMRKIRSIIICGFVLTTGIHSISFAKTAPRKSKADAGKTVYVKLKLNSDAPFKVSVAPLKYNKHLAFSFTLDDGYRSAFTCAYPLLNGGLVSPAIPDEYHSDQGGDGEKSDGLFYTNGCGKNVAFKLAVALNAGIVYDHPDNRARLSWAEVKTLYDAGWDILNHGYHHLSKHGTDYNTEVLQNIKVVQEKVGFTMTQFVVPGGEHDEGYEHIYEQDALKAGAYAVASYVGKGPAIDVNKPVDLKDMIYARNFLQSNKDSLDFKTIDRDLNRIDSLMKQPQPIWYNEFTHSVGDKNLWNLSMLYPEFKYYMTSIDKTYGAKGTDSIWMAPWQEVYEYIWLRDHIKVTSQQQGRNVVLKLEVPPIPANFRHTEISINIDTRTQFTVNNAAPLKMSNNGHNLLNIELGSI
ncbi:polysaccharide deacetylase family protein [Mucilaginibacter jinjuensis]|uniref:Polysaccharide deacetylase family protein n=1 Tax=Mucilaginibacter jinjuensis TaxID=1176721 RepID=A0ABY7T2R8_9SPHI|nr:polysaccharide deacetylase family protein [Mucilaginibacter jinjuensis]WCT10616.1 polysaccharide deacetylase family protein [Mucilaginibacter jinjuensis]